MCLTKVVDSCRLQTRTPGERVYHARTFDEWMIRWVSDLSKCSKWLYLFWSDNFPIIFNEISEWVCMCPNANSCRLKKECMPRLSSNYMDRKFTSSKFKKYPSWRNPAKARGTKTRKMCSLLPSLFPSCFPVGIVQHRCCVFPLKSSPHHEKSTTKPPIDQIDPSIRWTWLPCVTTAVPIRDRQRICDDARAPKFIPHRAIQTTKPQKSHPTHCSGGKTTNVSLSLNALVRSSRTWTSAGRNRGFSIP